MSLLVVLTIAVVFGIGIWLVLDADPKRIVLGTVLLGHSAIMMLVGSRPSGREPLVTDEAAAAVADPVPQALSLTAIVISFGVTVLLLAVVARR
ncbi:sodium:proton antiporter [Euzebya tangerina]|uniref:sodium:proton antiporter n=1 Tax=Euzebya tangerina TaxID=591198 RepID=UPI000E31BC57|nr:sodium:proton antiporter [Euzebya tangerina]